MNASKILQQLMKQASGGQQGSQQRHSQQSQSGGQEGGFDVQGMLGGLARQLGGGSNQRRSGGSQGGSSSGLNVKSLLGGGAMGLLLGSKRGRSMGGKAMKYGAIASVGALAWKAWQSSQQKSAQQESSQQQSHQQQNHQQQNYQQNNTQSRHGNATSSYAQEGQQVDALEGEFQERRSLELLQAMIMAARADGHIDEQEQALISEQIDALGADEELHRWVQTQLNSPLDAQALAREADSPQAAREMYLISVAVTDDQNPMERAWLDQLAKALNLPPDMAAELEHQAQQAG
ncbi:tellurite resistance TerB family protein [Halomonas sp. LS-001]